MISLNNVMGIIRRWENSIISLRFGFLEITHKNIWVSWEVLFKGLGVQKSTQTPCWLRPWHAVYYVYTKLILLTYVWSCLPMSGLVFRAVSYYGSIVCSVICHNDCRHRHHILVVFARKVSGCHLDTQLLKNHSQGGHLANFVRNF